MTNKVLRQKTHPIFLALFCTLALPGCATVIHGKTQTVEITSAPHGADVLVDGQPRGTTPLKTELRRGEPHVVTIAKQGYLDETVMTTTKLNATPILNAVLGGVPGLAVDLATGSATDVTPGTVSARLAPEVTPPTAVQPASYVPESDAGRIHLQ
ncbi:MAG: PEGA domain-containing protein [Rhodopirellula sp.]|nr:PEGA domain-containing protein [Rhodopirellula sp.]